MRLGTLLTACALGIGPLLLPIASSAQAPASPAAPPAGTAPAPSGPPGAAPDSTPGAGQDEQAMMRVMHRGARNQLGVLQYCQQNGSIGADVVVVQRQMLAMLPPAQVDGLDQAEAAGKRGIVQFAGQEMSIPDAAKARSTTPDAICKQIASAIQAQAAQAGQAPR